MASREETLLFIVDVQVHNARALRTLDAELDAVASNGERRLLALQDAIAGGGGNGGTQGVVLPGDRTGNGNRYTPVMAAGGVDRGLVGIRGPVKPGSRVNPVVMTEESGQASGLGSLAAATTAPGADRGAVPVVTPAPAPEAPSRSWLAQAAQDVAQKVLAPEQDRTVAAIQAAARLNRNVGGGTHPVLAAAEQVALSEAGNALAAPVGGARRSPAGQALASVLASSAASRDAQQRSGLAQQLADILAARQGSGGGPTLLSAAQAAGRLGVGRSKIYEMAGSGMLPGAQKAPSGEWQIPEQAVLAAAAGGSGGGGGLLPTALAGAGGAAAGGGGGNNGLLRRVLYGTGLLGLAGFGTVGSFAGLGPEHLLMTALGIGGSAVGAVGGAGLLGLGAAGVAGAGIGTDLAGIGQAAGDISNVVKAQNALTQAVAVYGKNSTQAKTAQAQLNATLNSFSPIAKAAVLAAANTAQGFHQAFNTATGEAEKTGAQILTETMQMGEKFLPLLGQYAAQNMLTIKQDIQPLFAWLTGPQGMGIFTNLEDEFQHSLPTAMGAFTQGIELLLRIVNLASQDTGGFTQRLDSLFTRLNSESNAQLDQEIQRLIGDFRTWEAFIKAIGYDLDHLFSNDVGTGSGIIHSLTVMLQKLGQWETSVNGRQSLTNIFVVHKAEILELLKVIPLLINGFAPIYMALAPALTTAFTTVASAIISVVKAIESIPGGTWLVGLSLIAAKVGLLATGLKALGLAAPASAAAAAGGATRVAGAAAAAGGTAAAAEGGAAGAGAVGLIGRVGATGLGGIISGGVEAGTLGVAGAAEGAGLTGLAGAITGAGAAIAPVAAGLLPLLAAAGGVYGLIKLFGLFSGSSAPTSKYSTNQLATLLQQHGTGALKQQGGPGVSNAQLQQPGGLVRFAVQGAQPTVGQLGPTPQAQAALKQWVATVSNSADVAKMSVGQLQGMVREGNALAQIFPKDAAVIDKFTGKLKTDLAPLQDAMKVMADRWRNDAQMGLSGLQDIFAANMRLAATVGGAEGTRLMAAQVKDMIGALTRGILDGRVSITAGMKAIVAVIQQGAKDGDTTWTTQWGQMFTTLDTLFKHHKITSAGYLSDIQSGMHTAFSSIKTDTENQYTAMFASLKTKLHQGWLDNAQYNQQVTTDQGKMTAQVSQIETGMVANWQASMKAMGALTAQGMQVIAKETNKALGLFGAAQLPIPQAIAWNNFQLSGGTGNTSIQGAGHGASHATGAKVASRTYMVGEEAGHPEYVLATNPAYRPRNLGLWAAAGRDLGVPGFATGGLGSPGLGGSGQGASGAGSGYVYPLPGASLGRTDEGVDGSMAPGSPIGPIGDARIMGVLPGWGGRGPNGVGDLLWWQLLNGPRAGQYAYVAEQITNLASGLVRANQAVARFASTGSGFEYGWASAGGEPLAHPYYTEGEVTPPGVDMRNFLAGLSHGVITGGGSGGVGGGGISGPVWKALTAPRVRGGGALGAIVNAALKKATAAANKLGQSKAGMAGGGGGTFAGTLSGPVEKQVFEFMSAAGFNKIAVAGMLGNALQESSMNVNEAGGGFWQQISNFGQGTGGTLLNQMQVMLPQIRGLRGAMNAAGSPGAAATIFMNDFEKPKVATENLPRRIAGANAAYAAGYARGGMPAFAGVFGNGGMVTANKPTMAIFGDKGPETAMFIPQFAGGGIVAAAEAAGAAAPKTGAGYSFINNPTSDQYAILQDKSLTSHQKAVALAYLAHPTGASGGGSSAPTGSSSSGGVKGMAGWSPLAAAGWLKFVAGVTAETAAAKKQAKVLTTGLNTLTSAFTNEQTKAGNISTLTGALEGLKPGTSLKSIGLTGAGLKASGLTKAQAQALIGGGPGSYGVLAGIDQTEITQLTGQAASLKKLYAKALKEHNTKLQKAILAQLGAVDGAITTTLADKQTQWLNAVAAAIGLVLQNFTNQITAAANTSTTLTAIQGLTGGESLASLGLSPAILATLGLSGAQSQVGSGLSVFQALQSSQGGTLTAAQLAQATSGVTAANASITSQETPIEGELAYDQNVLLPGATGQNKVDLINTMQGLVQQLLGLQGSIDSNNAGLAALTAATGANTAATTSNTGAMTGTVAYSYQGQQYLATLSSDNPTNTGVGS